MKAIQIPCPSRMNLVEIERPSVANAGDVLVKITSGSICGSDIGIYNGTNSLASYPRIIGHEFGGRVIETGSGVTRVKPGDLVAVDPVVSCGHCYACGIGRHNVCSTLEVMGVHRDGGFAEYAVADQQNIHKFSDQSFDPGLVALVEPYSIGMEICNRAQIQNGSKVWVMGAGPIGICAMQVAQSRGASVIMSDIIARRLERAKEMGADETILVGEDSLEQKLLDFAGADGVPVIVDTVCTPESFEQSVRMSSPAGCVVVLGLRNEPSKIVAADITKKGLTIVGSRLNCNCFEDVIRGFESGALQPQLLKTHEYHYTQAEEAIRLILTQPQEVLKVALRFDD